MQKKIVLNAAEIEILQSIGATFKNRREQLSCSISRAAEITRMPASVLMALEQGDLEELPDLVFLRGFVRAYAKFLDIDSQSIVDDLNTIFQPKFDEPANKKNVHRAGELSAPVFQDPQKESNSFSALIVYIVLAVAVLALAGWFFVVNPFFETTKVVSQTASPTTDATSTVVETAPIQQAEQVVLRAIKSGWVSVRIDDELTQEFKVQVGQNFEWGADQQISITLSRGDIAELDYNDRPWIIPLQQSNRLTKIEFPPARQ